MNGSQEVNTNVLSDSNKKYNKISYEMRDKVINGLDKNIGVMQMSR